VCTAAGVLQAADHWHLTVTFSTFSTVLLMATAAAWLVLLTQQPQSGMQVLNLKLASSLATAFVVYHQCVVLGELLRPSSPHVILFLAAWLQSATGWDLSSTDGIQPRPGGPASTRVNSVRVL
jgi:flagellar biosynthesis component FlhA